MVPTEHISPTSLRIERTFDAPPERVFDAWTRPEIVARWFAPTEEHQVVVTSLDAVVGGRYRIEMRHSGGNVHTATGVYREVTRPTRLVMTWMWEGKEADGETLLSIALHPDGPGTRMTLTHERFPGSAERDAHDQGWAGCLSRLESLMTGLTKH